MDWNLAIEINRAALKRILAMLVAMAGLPASPPPSGVAVLRPTLPRHLHRAILRLLRPAESAARRLVIVAARGIVLPVAGRSGAPGAMHAGAFSGQAGVTATPAASRRPHPGPASGDAANPPLHCSLPLLDPLFRFRQRRPVQSSVPRISFPGFTRPALLPPPPRPDDPIDATRLALRLQALERTLDDLSGHARRFARWRSRREVALAHREQGAAVSRTVCRWPLRMGRPPGWRRLQRLEVHEVLARTNGLALLALDRRDTS